MSGPPFPTGPRATWILVERNLHFARRWAAPTLALLVFVSFGVMGVLLPLFGTGGLMMDLEHASAPPHVLVVSADPTLGDVASRAVRGVDWTSELQPTAPHNLELKLRFGMVEAVLIVQSQAEGPASAELRVGPHARAEVNEQAEARLAATTRALDLAHRLGPAPTVQWTRPPASPTSAAQPSNVAAPPGTPGRIDDAHAVRLLALMFGMIATTTAQALVGGRSAGHRAMLVHLSGPRALYTADVASGVGLAIAVGLVSLAGKAAIPWGDTGATAAATPVEPSMVILFAIGGVFTLQVLPIALVFARAEAESTHVARRGWKFASVAAILGFTFLVQVMFPEAAPWLPGAGVGALLAAAHGASLPWHQALAQVAWIALALPLGAAIYAPVEGPIARLQRAWRRLPAATP